ncbi:hypothetical protein HZC07_05650 [Candidatus Micrarchaeota archaeon]|nr:hypothetical protein [Candidatus Micrarchaeota archaeon]
MSHSRQLKFVLGAVIIGACYLGFRKTFDKSNVSNPFHHTEILAPEHIRFRTKLPSPSALLSDPVKQDPVSQLIQSAEAALSDCDSTDHRPTSPNSDFMADLSEFTLASSSLGTPIVNELRNPTASSGHYNDPEILLGLYKKIGDYAALLTQEQLIVFPCYRNPSPLCLSIPERLICRVQRALALRILFQSLQKEFEDKFVGLIGANPRLAGRILFMLPSDVVPKVIDRVLRLSDNLGRNFSTIPSYWSDIEHAFNSTYGNSRSLFGSRVTSLLSDSEFTLTDLSGLLSGTRDSDLRLLISSVIASKQSDPSEARTDAADVSANSASPSTAPSEPAPSSMVDPTPDDPEPSPEPSLEPEPISAPDSEQMDDSTSPAIVFVPLISDGGVGATDPTNPVDSSSKNQNPDSDSETVELFDFK